MEKVFLGIDIGTTYLKSAILHIGKRSISESRRIPSPAYAVCSLDGQPLQEGRKEIPLRSWKDAVQALMEDASRKRKIEGILLSTQMHGFALFDPDGQPVTNYITWEDMRGTEKITGQENAHIADSEPLLAQCVLEELQETRYASLFRENGVLPQSNHSVVPLVHYVREHGLRDGLRFSMIGDALIFLLTGQKTPVHPTNAASSGLYSLEKQDWNRELIKVLGLGQLDFPEVSDSREPVAVWHGPCGDVPLYAALGDQQASLLGIGVKSGDAFLNIATGGQIGCVVQTLQAGTYETRPYLSGNYLRTFTQMPSGRTVRVIFDFLQSVGRDVFGCGPETEERIWAYLSTVPKSKSGQESETQREQAEKIITADSALRSENALRMNVSFFSQEGGSLTGIMPDRFTADRLVDACYREIALTYRDGLKQLMQSQDKFGSENILETAKVLRKEEQETEVLREVICTGGAIRKNPALFQTIAQTLPLPCRIAPEGEDSMLGLMEWISGGR